MMERSEFLSLISRAASKDREGVDRVASATGRYGPVVKTVQIAKELGLYFRDPTHIDDYKNPVILAIRAVRSPKDASSISLESLIALDKAWEYYQEQSRQKRAGKEWEESRD